MVAGEFFSKEKPAQIEEGLVLNEAAVKALELESPIGKRVEENRVIGVIKDFHFYSLHQKIAPLIISSGLEAYAWVFLKIDGEDMESTIRFVETTWKQFAPAFPFEYSFLDDRIDAMYRTDRRIGRLINVFTALAVVVACLGLFGLASFMAERRAKEIGVRKVLGAPVSSIVIMLSKSFLKWICISNLIAWPVSFVLMNRWLQEFAYRTSFKPQLFPITGLFSIFIALFTVSTQSIRAALTNPVKSLRSE